MGRFALHVHTCWCGTMLGATTQPALVAAIAAHEAQAHPGRSGLGPGGAAAVD